MSFPIPSSVADFDPEYLNEASNQFDPIFDILKQDGDDFRKFLETVVRLAYADDTVEKQLKRYHDLVRAYMCCNIYTVVDCIKNLTLVNRNLSDRGVEVQLNEKDMEWITFIGAEWLLKTKYSQPIHEPDKSRENLHPMYIRLMFSRMP